MNWRLFVAVGAFCLLVVWLLCQLLVWAAGLSPEGQLGFALCTAGALIINNALR